MATYLKRKKRKIQADYSLDAPIHSSTAKPGSEQSGTYADILPEDKTTDPAVVQEEQVSRSEKATEMDELRQNAPALLETMRLYYNKDKTVLPELRELIDTLYSIYINENTEGDKYESAEVSDIKHQEKYAKGPSVKALFEQYFFNNINDILSSTDIFTYGIHTIKKPYLEQIEILKNGI